MNNSAEWICCQVGAREFYAIPRALNQTGLKNLLITDLWCNQNQLPWKYLPLTHSRHHPKISSDQVKSFNNKFLFNKILGKDLNGKTFADVTAKYLRFNRNRQFKNATTLFSYSYSAGPIFKAGKEMGLKTVMGQINPGPREAEIVVEAFKKEFGNKYPPNVPDESYWDYWRNECEMADVIVVNSQWSKKLLIEDGVPNSKIKIIPLAYESKGINDIDKTFKNRFTRQYPLQILYLGSISVRKGFHILKRAFGKLKDLPVKLSVVGGVNGPDELISDLPENIIYHGRVSPIQINAFYQNSDLFILPTLSDGFARTLLEAQFWKLPVITTPFCGDVITHQKNGLIIPEVTEDHIINAIQLVLKEPYMLQRFSDNANNLSEFSFENIGKKLAVL